MQLDRKKLLLLTLAAANLGCCAQARAESAPDRGLIGYKYLDYLDYQADADRVRVKASAFVLTAPIGSQWAFSATAVSDSITGASPQYHDKLITPLEDKRKAYTASITRYFSQSNYTLSASSGRESDYLSKSGSLTANFLSESKNTTVTIGYGNASDEIIGADIGRKTKHVSDAVLGVTQVLTMNDIVQATYRHSWARGYFSDQYKLLDERPGKRDSDSILLRWNRYMKDWNATLRSSYRYYQDDFDIRSHTAGLEFVKNLGDSWQVAPLIRYYSQTKASFYYDPDPNDPLTAGGTIAGVPLSKILPALDSGGYASMDHRLSSFGAWTYGVKITRKIGRDWVVDAKYEKYEQRGEWALSDGSPGLSPFHARSFQVGFVRFFD